jgi:UDP-glucose 4-epimerase
MTDRKKVLVTGGAGFIGSHVADDFFSRGYDVVVVDDLSTGLSQNLGDYTFVKLDVRSAEFKNLLCQQRFDIVCHLAAQIDVRASVSEPVLDADTNILGTLNLLEGLRASANPTRVVFSSTGGALYGSAVEAPTAEHSPKEPESPYGIGKLAAEHYLSYYAHVHRIDSIVLRFGNVYGPRQNALAEAGVIAIFCNRLVQRRPLTVFGDGEQTRDYVYVRDVAHAVFQAATLPIPPLGGLDSRAFNIATGIGTSVLSLAKTLKQVSGIDVPLEFQAARAGEVLNSVLSQNKAKDFGLLSSPTELRDGLADTFQWFSENRST